MLSVFIERCKSGVAYVAGDGDRRALPPSSNRHFMVPFAPRISTYGHKSSRYLQSSVGIGYGLSFNLYTIDTRPNTFYAPLP